MLKTVRNETGPAFSAYAASNVTITSGVFTKVQINTEEFDTDGCFDTVLHRFTPTRPGLYQVSGSVSFGATSASPTRCAAVAFKNGAQAKRFNDISAAGTSVQGSALIYMNGTTDYLELYAFISAATAVYAGSQSSTYFQAVFVRSA